MAILLDNCDFSNNCAAADKISTDLRRRAVPLRQLSYLLIVLYLVATVLHCTGRLMKLLTRIAAQLLLNFL